MAVLVALLGICLPLSGAGVPPASGPGVEPAAVADDGRALRAWSARLTAETAARVDAATRDAVVLADAALAAVVAARDLATVRPDTAALVEELEQARTELDAWRGVVAAIGPRQPVPGTPVPDAGVAVEQTDPLARYGAAQALRASADRGLLLSVQVDQAVAGTGEHAARLAGLAELEALAAAAADRAEDVDVLPVAGTGVADGAWVARVAASGRDPWPNGAVPVAALCPVEHAPGHLLRCDAAAALAGLAAAYEADTGRRLRVTNSYRTLEEQVRLRAEKGWLAAPPGTSQHGRGLAVDLADMGELGRFDAPAYRWMTRNAPAFGWFHPAAMEPGGSGPPEPWHWEYLGTGGLRPLDEHADGR